MLKVLKSIGGGQEGRVELYLPLGSQFREEGLHEIQTACSRLWHFNDVMANLNNHNEGFI